jgi:hypothetical protein
MRDGPAEDAEAPGGRRRWLAAFGTSHRRYLGQPSGKRPWSAVTAAL